MHLTGLNNGRRRPTTTKRVLGDMMRRSEKITNNWMEPEEALTEHFLAPESDEQPAAVAVELRDRVTKVEQQVLAQYTATAAYATLAQQGLKTTRDEARADLDRTQSTLIGLLDRLRMELSGRLDGIESRPSLPSTSLALDAASRLAMMEDRMNAMVGALESCVRDNMVLRQQVDELLQRQMQQDGWLVSSGSASELSLR
jgi:replicative DNA helicase